VVNLKLRDMVAIRDDDSFGVFRSDMNTALVDADTDVRSGRIDMARRVVGEHMDAGLPKLNASTRRGIIGDATLGVALTRFCGV
jgi:hypothetical protein